MLWLCLHLPNLPLEICSRGAPGDRPFVVAEGEGREQRVALATVSAGRRGVRPGMRVSEAHALVRGLGVKRRDTTAEREALERLAAWSVQYTSSVSVVPPDALLLEIEGSRNLYGGCDRLLSHLRRGLSDLGYAARLAVAPTPLGATWLARQGQEAQITDHAALFQALARLSLTCLELDSREEALLKGLGLSTLIDCLRLPRDGIARRVGPRILTALDRAFGRLPDPRAPFIAPERFRARLGLPAPTAMREALLFPLHRLLLELAGFLAARGAGAAALHITLHSTRSASTPLSLGLVAPSRDAQHLIDLVRERLERLTLAAPVEEIIVEVDALLPLAPRPLDLFTGAQNMDEARAQMIERFQARLGRETVHSVASCAEHRPERAWRPVAPGAATNTHANSRWPLWLLPEPVALDLRGGQLYWDGVLALEPERERIESGWWDGAEIARDYFIARNPAGRRFWVFRELHSTKWFLHGLFG